MNVFHKLNNLNYPNAEINYFLNQAQKNKKLRQVFFA